jgi:hypothetical protein
MHYAKSKREKKSICNLCREEKALSWDHVPPKGEIELGPVEMETVFEIMAGDREKPKLRESQNGVKYRTICGECNSLLGREYDPTINGFATSIGRYLKSDIALPEEIHIFYWIYPYGTSVVIRDFGMFVPRGTFNELAIFQLLKYYPVAYLCSTKPEYAGLPALSWYRDAELDFEIEIPINLKRVEGPYWPEAPNDEDNNVFFGGQSAAAAVHSRPRENKA